ncbi:hypothetical protein BDA99DRAFT_576099 [Phascolomyces articulosus]|uniref:Uncharacterized protein n=1 Tax=Phascolomyces articulosus TaxID=60185 RepID=A0AAD5P917_9FUNG|nr:hypothetical protein BDA99DRAFT_576099 [Phascolomyces articulosus]
MMCFELIYSTRGRLAVGISMILLPIGNNMFLIFISCSDSIPQFPLHIMINQFDHVEECRAPLPVYYIYYNVSRKGRQLKTIIDKMLILTYYMERTRMEVLNNWILSRTEDVIVTFLYYSPTI